MGALLFDLVEWLVVPRVRVQNWDAYLCQTGNCNQHLEPVFNTISGFSPLNRSLLQNIL